MDNVFRQSQPLLAYVGQPIENKQSEVVTAKWYNRHTNINNSVTPLNNLNSTMTKPDEDYRSPDHNNDTSDIKGLPSAEQLKYLYDKLEQTVSIQ